MKLLFRKVLSVFSFTVAERPGSNTGLKRRLLLRRSIDAFRPLSPLGFSWQACLLIGLTALNAPQALAGSLQDCIGMSPNGYLQCTVTPQIIGPWKYSIAGPVWATPEAGSERATIEEYKARWASIEGYTACGSIADTVGPFDAQWENDLAIFHRKYDFLTLNTYRRKPVDYSWSRRLTTDNSPNACQPLSVSTYVYSQRLVNCAEGWYPDDAPESAFCALNEPYDDTSCPINNPVLPALGIKVHGETDYTGAGAHPLSFTRLYRSRWPLGVNSGKAAWSHNWASKIVALEGAPIRTVRLMRPDGTVRSFTQAKQVTGQPIPAWQPDTGFHDQLTEQRDANGQTTGWTIRVFTVDNTEIYDGQGKLLSVRQRNGWTTTLTYGNVANPSQLTAVTNQFGRQIKLVYDSAGRLSQLLPPGAVQDAGAGAATSPIRYNYQEIASLAASVPAANQLTSVTWQDGAVKRYHYEDARFANALTGLTDEAGVRISNYSYNAKGQVAEESKVGGTERVTLTYSGSSTQMTEYSAANSSGTVRSFSFRTIGGKARPTSSSSLCPQCGNTAASTVYGDGGAATGGAGALGQIFSSKGHDQTISFFKYNVSVQPHHRLSGVLRVRT
jgi:Domain of unknown function (DUF6531)